MVVRCMALHHGPRPPRATHVCRGASWQDKTLYLCGPCASNHAEDTRHDVTRIDEALAAARKEEERG